MKDSYSFDPSSKKFICPNCRKKRLVKFINKNGYYLDSCYGKCDRSNSCGYLKFPNKEAGYNLVSSFSEPQKKPTFIDFEFVEESQKMFSINPLYNYLIKRFPKEEVLSVFKKYKIGTSKHWEGSAVFWQIDCEGKVRSGKVIKYDSITGKRIKTPTPKITWVHKLLSIKDFTLKQVLFGEHLLNQHNIDTIVCIVESEKTALMSSIVAPEYLWLATGSLNQFNIDRLSILRGRKIVVFPDSDGHTKWTQKASILSSQLKTDIYVSNLILDKISKSEYKEGVDLADIIAKSKLAVNTEEIINDEVHSVVNRMMKKNPALQLLIDRFDLVVDNST